VRYYSQSKVVIYLSKQINPVINKSEGLSKVIMWPGYKESLVFLETQNTQVVSQIMNTTQIVLESLIQL